MQTSGGAVHGMLEWGEKRGNGIILQRRVPCTKTFDMIRLAQVKEGCKNGHH